MKTSVKRQSNIELLRLLAMLGVVLVHIVNHGKIIDYSHPFEASFIGGWILFSPGFCSINIFLLITGYFMVEQKFSTWKIARLIGQVLFYALGITILFAIFSDRSIQGKEILYSVFPVSSDLYWYASMYVALCLLSPLLNRFVKALTKSQLKCVCILLFVLLSVWSNVFFYSSALNTAGGVSIAWFVCVYIWGAYIRLHYVPDGKWGKKLLCSVLLLLLLPLSKFFLEWIVTTPVGNIGFLNDLLWGYSIFYTYSSILVVIISISIFIAFLNMKIESPTVCRIINISAGASFGVYLIHDHLYMRESLWNWVGVSDWYSKWYLVPMCLTLMIALYIACMCVELLRQKLFSLWEKDSALKRWFLRLDDKLRNMWNGKSLK